MTTMNQTTASKRTGTMMAAALCTVALSLSGCVMPQPGHEYPDEPAPPAKYAEPAAKTWEDKKPEESAVDAAGEESLHDPDFWGRVAYDRFWGRFNPYKPESETSTVCVDELKDTYAKYGLTETHRHTTDVPDQPLWAFDTCTFSSAKYKDGEVVIAVEPTHQEVIEKDGARIIGPSDQSLIKRGYISEGYLMDPQGIETTCQYNIDTTLGRVSVGYRSANGALEEDCAIAEEHFVNLFKDKEFLDTLWGYRLPLSRPLKEE
ncbi:hypothetical protein C1Y63_06760 [Corynebacterium sp. 13CS0277]|uniref:hypothetical protein n=1 Tax=Corynebacterium sp. 13CS0277 TaxID=2071994 RepID=UPI000D0287F9|nr:hypothetical protein [Corynebacterium sp. 13CS0277]PRQ11249.1 hypothetical protein C1Y63_06760 [Corynebacterium sp. 13CS0277]